MEDRERVKTAIICATSINGWIGRNTDSQPDWTSPEDMAHFKSLTLDYGVVIVGRRTFSTMTKPLIDRLNIVLTKNPHRMKPQKGVWYTDQTPFDILIDLSRRGFSKAAIIGGEQINTLFWNLNLVDELIITIEPIIFSGKVALLSTEAKERRLKQIETQPLSSGGLIVRYRLLD